MFYGCSKTCSISILLLKDASFFFSGCPRCTLPCEMRLSDTTCCVIKPHIIREGKYLWKTSTWSRDNIFDVLKLIYLGRAGVVLGDIVAAGFEITGLGMFWLNKREAEEFYEIYKRIYVESEYWVKLWIQICPVLWFNQPFCDKIVL